MNKWIIYTDGSCRKNKDGGIGIIWLKNGNKILEYSKKFKNTTNNQMELMAIYAALISIRNENEIASLEIISDSEYSIGVLTKPWNPKKNIDLINKIKKQIVETQKLVSTPIKWTHVRGHQKDTSEHTIWNNLCNKLAQNSSL